MQRGKVRVLTSVCMSRKTFQRALGLPWLQLLWLSFIYKASTYLDVVLPTSCFSSSYIPLIILRYRLAEY